MFIRNSANIMNIFSLLGVMQTKVLYKNFKYAANSTLLEKYLILPLSLTTDTC